MPLTRPLSLLDNIYFQVIKGRIATLFCHYITRISFSPISRNIYLIFLQILPYSLIKDHWENFFKALWTLSQAFSQLLNHVGLFVAPWTVAYQAPLFMEFSRQEYWSALPFPTPGNLPEPRDQTHLSSVSCIDSWSLYHWTTWEAPALTHTLPKAHCLVSAPPPHLSVLLLFITAFYFQVSKSISFFTAL